MYTNCKPHTKKYLFQSSNKRGQLSYKVIKKWYSISCYIVDFTVFCLPLKGLGDSKTWIRSASLTAINSIGDVCGYNAFFEGEMVGDALKTGSPALRIELWAWLADKLPKSKLKF